MYALLDRPRLTPKIPERFSWEYPGDEMTCPQCSSTVCLRVQRRGWRDFMWRLKRCFPWHCRQCGNRFYHVRRR